MLRYCSISTVTIWKKKEELFLYAMDHLKNDHLVKEAVKDQEKDKINNDFFHVDEVLTKIFLYDCRREMM